MDVIRAATLKRGKPDESLSNRVSINMISGWHPPLGGCGVINIREHRYNCTEITILITRRG